MEKSQNRYTVDKNVYKGQNTNGNYKKSKQIVVKNLIVLLLKILLIVIILVIFFNYIFGLQRLNDNSMFPYIREGELVLYVRNYKDYAEDDVVIAELNKKKYILRVAAVAGQTVDINKNGELTVDGYVENHLTVYSTKLPDNSNIQYPYKVKDGELFLLQDNRMEYNDSRTFGGVSKKNIKGKVISGLRTRNI